MKVKFDPRKKSHREAVRNFLENNTWGINGCPFFPENPRSSITAEITSKLIKHFLKVDNQESII